MSPSPSARSWTRLLLLGGILSSLLYVFTDVVAAARYPGYSISSQMVSELFAVGAPTRPFVVRLFLIYGLLTILFGVGVFRSAGPKRSLRIAAILLLAYGAVGLAGPFAPMHQRGTVTSMTDTMHIVVTGAISLLMLLAIAFGSGAGGKGFRIYSILTIVLLVVGGGLAGLQGPKVPKGLETPGFGILERVDIYSTLLWVAVLAVLRLKALGGLGSKAGSQGQQRTDRMALTLRSEAFADGERMPARFSRKGGNASPPLGWSEPPQGTRSLALTVVDIDTPVRLPVTHWIVFNIPPAAGRLPEGQPTKGDLGGGIIQGRNWARRNGFIGPDPPWGEHRYVFTLYALDIRLKPDPRLSRRKIRKAMKGHVLAETGLTGTFAR